MQGSDSEGRKRTVILITNHFPFGLAEAFLESEIPFLIGSFDKVIILARDVKSKGLRVSTGNFNYERVNPQSNLKEKIITATLLVKQAKKVYKFIADELKSLKRRGLKVSGPIFKVIIHDLTKALSTSYHIEKLIKKYRVQGQVILYSYWLTSSALATTFVDSYSNSIKRIARAHGGDVYETRNALNYLSFREVLAKHLHAIFTISDHAAQHLKNQISNSLAQKIVVSKLGSKPAGNSVAKTEERYLIVSCSFLSPVKRIELVIKTLEQIHGVHIMWMHIGDGELRYELEKLAFSTFKNKENIEFLFHGSLTHDELMHFYRSNYVDVFINTSSSEGVPVTIMEAQSFGIPVVAPHVGGIPEIVDSTNGKLFPVDSSPHEIASALLEVLMSPVDQYEELRINAYRNWERRYNAEKNFSTFVAQIQSLENEV